MTKIAIPRELHKVRDAARRAIRPIKPADEKTKATADFLFTAKHTEASRDLSPYYLIYFLLVDLLGFRDLGRFEKLDWSIPIDLDGVAYLIDHRKFGVGVFAGDTPDSEREAQRVVALMNKGVKTAAPFFKWMADKAVEDSKINVQNVARKLFARYLYFRDRFAAASAEAKSCRNEYEARPYQSELPEVGYSVNASKDRSRTELIAMFSFPWARMSEASSWLALAAVDAFFAWTEHVFIHLAILQGRIKTGLEVARTAEADWNTKFKCALDITDSGAKKHLDDLLVIRRQLRNFVAHGAFGKEGQAFSFHSNAGAVPVVFDHKSAKRQFSLTPELAFNDTRALEAIEAFIAYLWAGPRAPARNYIQESDLPLILPMASDGRYAAAMATVDDMEAFIHRLMHQFDASANMDWALMNE